MAFRLQWRRHVADHPDRLAALRGRPVGKVEAAHAASAEPWKNPETHASGLRVPGPLGDRLILRALYESDGLAGAASEEAIRAATAKLSRESGIDTSPEGGCAFAVCSQLVAAGRIARDSEVVIYNTGSGAGYRS